jgi:hypothetical protein
MIWSPFLTRLKMPYAVRKQLIGVMGAFAGGFQKHVSMCYPPTASVQPESRYHWNNLYHSTEIEREVAR